ncbi:histidyl-tRNA synthetase [Babesia ovata]|uniref:histidine--tRNA ligase n=1 Tax=Babesia ovata TaxID=189622 RepID=A0A2H6KGM8_9APIC|nr:histidyl-tRNA synthetase [Babesia ovata]GBE62148.1 histidyl-tRNA synthetase [Babesia ovata]
MLSMEELFSVALSKRALVLEPELARSLGVATSTSIGRSEASDAVTGAAPRGSSYRDSLIGRMICCALLQKAVRRRPAPSSGFILKLFDALNGAPFDVSMALESLHLRADGLGDADSVPSSGVVRTLASVAKVGATGSEDDALSKIATSLGLTEDECAALSHGQTELFATVSVLGLVLSSLSKFSDCAVGLACEALRIPTQCLSSAEIQKLPHCVGVARNLIWLTEDSKLIPSSATSGDTSLELILPSYMLANGELGHLSKTVIKITSEMFAAICGGMNNPASQKVAEHAWIFALQSHVANLCRCLTSVGTCYMSLLRGLTNHFKVILSEIQNSDEASGAGNSSVPEEAKTSVSEYENLLQSFETSLAGFETQSASIEKLDKLAGLCGDMSVACVSLSTSILSLQQRPKGKVAEAAKAGSDAGERKLLLGHGNLGVDAYLRELLGDDNVSGMKSYQVLCNSLAGPRLLHQLARVETLLIPRNQKVRKLKVPKGTIDTLPEEMLVRTIVLDAVRSIFKQHGACEIDTPVFELRETLMGKYGEDQKLIFDLKDSGGEQLSLRYDLTVPFARFLASNKIDKMKRYQIGKVYRRDEPQINRGRFREFVQCDLDYAGAHPPMAADAEVIFILIRILRMLRPEGFHIKIGHRVILDAIMSHCGVPSEMHRTICSSIDKLDKEPWSDVRDEMMCEKGLPESVVNALQDLVETKGPMPDVVAFLRGKNIPGTALALDEMVLLNDYLSAYGVTADELSFDLSLARGLDYYTGVIFEAVLTGASVGSVGAGGRYDGLIGVLSGRSVPSVGMSVGIERLMKAVDHCDLTSDITDVFVCTIGDESMALERLRLCSLLWDGGITAEFHYNARANLRKQFDAATAKRAQLAVVVGMSEVAAGTVRIKPLSYTQDDSTDEQGSEKVEEIVVSRAKMVHTVRRILSEENSVQLVKMKIGRMRLVSLVALLGVVLSSTAFLPCDAFLWFFGRNKGSGKVSMFFHAIPYIFRKSGCVPWVNKATNDDILSNKFIYIDLFSRKHHDAIEATPQDDDTVNKRTNILLYQVNTELLPHTYDNPTLGDVMYYSQLLQEYGEYDRRTILTYKDDLKRLCVLIESYDVTGERVSMRLFRARRKVWWLKQVASEGNVLSDTWATVMSTLGWSAPKPVVKQTLNIKESNCPLGMVNHKAPSYDIIYNRNAGSGTENIGDVIFRTMPMTLMPGSTDLYIWRFCETGKHENIKYVVIAEIFPTHSSHTYYRCLSVAESQYEVVDSFALVTGAPEKLESANPFPNYTKELAQLSYNFGATRDHRFEQDLVVLAYPGSKHYLIRPLSRSNLKVIMKMEVHGSHNGFDLGIEDADGYTYVACTEIDKKFQRRISLASVNGTKLALISARVSLEKAVDPNMPLCDQHTYSLLRHGLPIQYLGLAYNERISSSKFVDLDFMDYNESDVLAGQVGHGMILYTPSLGGCLGFKNLVIGKEQSMTLKTSINTQVLVAENGKKTVIALVQDGVKEMQLYETNGNSATLVDANKKFKLLKEYDLAEFDRITKDGVTPVQSLITLNLNDPMINGDVELFMVSNNVVVYTPQNAESRILVFVWGREQLMFEETSNPIFTVISGKGEKYLLVDDFVAQSNRIDRYLYAMEETPLYSRLRLLAKTHCATSAGINDIRNALENTWYTLIPEKLPVLADFHDPRIGNATFTYHNMSTLFLHHDHEFSLGVMKVGQAAAETEAGHRWRQVFRNTVGDGNIYSIYTMTPKGIRCDRIGADNKMTTETMMTYRRRLYPTLSKDSVVCMLENLALSDVKSVVSKIGTVKVTVVKPSDSSKAFNPLVFGHHEIQFVSPYKCVKVTISEQPDGLREISADLSHSDGGSSMINFREKNPGSGFFRFVRDDEEARVAEGRFVDVNEMFANYAHHFENLGVVDFNNGIFPHYVRYLTLAENKVYLTGNVMHTGLRIVFGTHTVNVDPSSNHFHLWVTYPGQKTETATLHVHYTAEEKPVSAFYTVENSADAKMLRRPREFNCNWGPLSNLELSTVNNILTRHTQLRGELATVNLDLGVGVKSPVIIKMNRDPSTTVYTTLASSGCVIDHVMYKGAIIRGVPKQIVKHVYHSVGPKDEIVLIVVRTIAGVRAQAYRFTNVGSFETVDLSRVDATDHSSIHFVMNQLS